MIVLDTNVVSEVMRPQPSAFVLDWLGRRRPEDVFVSAITEAEVRSGVAILADGKRRVALAHAVDEMFSNEFSGRILPFDSQATAPFAGIMAHRRALGRPIAMADGMIAAICLLRGFKLATRNVRDFEDTGVEVVDPFQDTSQSN